VDACCIVSLEPLETRHTTVAELGLWMQRRRERQQQTRLVGIEAWLDAAAATQPIATRVCLLDTNSAVSSAPGSSELQALTEE